MQTDTLIGIVGAAVLVAVMVGVFAYEYNNTPETDDNGGTDVEQQERLDAFNATYPTLDPYEDIDENGVPNWQEENITLHVVKEIEGTVAAYSAMNQAPQNTDNTFFVGTGATGGMVTVTWTVTVAPVTGTVIDNLQVSVQGVDGVACSHTDGQATCDLAGAAPGEYTITVQHARAEASQAKPFEGTVEIHY